MNVDKLHCMLRQVDYYLHRGDEPGRRERGVESEIIMVLSPRMAFNKYACRRILR